MTIEFIKDLEADEIKSWQSMYKEDLVESKATKLTYQQRKKLSDSDFAVVITVKKKKGTGTRKIRMFPIQDEAHVRAALSRLGQVKVKATLRRLGVSVDKVMKKVLARAKKLGMTELVKKHSTILSPEEVVEKLQLDLKKSEETVTTLEKEKKEADQAKINADKEKEEAAKAKEKLEAEKLEAEKQKELAEKARLQKEAEAKLYKENGEKIAGRKVELGDFVKDLSDEDLLNETKYEIAKLKKENFELRSKNENLETGHKEEINGMKKLRADVTKEKKY